MFASEIRNFHHSQRIANSEPQVQEKERSHIQGSTLLLEMEKYVKVKEVIKFKVDYRRKHWFYGHCCLNLSYFA